MIRFRFACLLSILLCPAIAVNRFAGRAWAADPPVDAVAAPSSAEAPVEQAMLNVEDPPVGLFADEWYALMLNDAKSGHMHSTMERIQRDGGDIIRTAIKLGLEVGRGDSRITMTFDQSMEETLDGLPLSFKHTMRFGKIPVTTSGKIKDGKVTITSYQLGIPTGRTVFKLPEGAIMAWGIYREQFKRGLEPGLKYDLSVYEPTLSPDRLTPTTVEVFGRETLDVFGRKVEAIKTRQTVHVQGTFGGQTSLDTTVWMTDTGTAVRLLMTVPPLDVPFDVLACPKAVALAPNNPKELMVDTFIRPDRRIDARNLNRVTYKLEWKKPSGEKVVSALPETGMQEIMKREDNGVILRLTRRSFRVEAAPSETTRPAERDGSGRDDPKRYLESTSDLNYKDPVVARLAREAAGDEKDPHKLAEKLCEFVHEYVDTKNLGVGFATASEVARSKEGDCTEHGVLLAALGRAVGIPTRIVTGFVYADRFIGQQDVFVGHLWTQFWIDGQWVDLDAALGQTDVDPSHIAIGLSAGDTGGVADLVTSGWLNMSNLRIKVLDKE